jgi:hypothetical protein
MFKRELCGIEVIVRIFCSKCELRQFPTVSVAMQDVVILQMSIWARCVDVVTHLHTM